MENTQPNKQNSGKSFFTIQRGVSFASEFGLVIALPLVAFAFAGKWLDARYHTGKAYTLVGILVALLTSMLVLSKRINSIRKELKSSS